MPPAHVLVVDDDRVACELLAEIVRREGHVVVSAGDGEEAIGHLPEGFDLVISDVRLGDGPSGMDVLAAFRDRSPQTPVILITAFGDVTGAMSAIQAGAHDYVSKPYNVGELVGAMERALERRRALEENRAQRPQSDSAQGIALGDRSAIVGRAPAMLEVYKMVARVAPSSSTVLVVGESGTGKELVARAIHAHSPRKDAPFVAVNCTALTETLLESELFGHEKGSFTGAVSTKRGLFEEARGGTLFLDEIGDIGPKMQAQLLRVLQEGRIRRVGGSEEIRIDVRIVAATNRDLGAEVRAARFREDLYFRVNVVTIRTPPLREHPSDIPLLVAHFVAKHALSRFHGSAGISPEAMAMLSHHKWQGNVRELENVVERALALAKDGFIVPADLPAEVTASAPQPPANLIDDRPTLAELDRRYIDLVLKDVGGNKKRAAEILGIDRRTLYRTLEREGRERDDDES